MRIDTPEELTAFRHGGILPYVLRQLVDKSELTAQYWISRTACGKNAPITNAR